MSDLILVAIFVAVYTSGYGGLRLVDWWAQRRAVRDAHPYRDVTRSVAEGGAIRGGN